MNQRSISLSFIKICYFIPNVSNVLKVARAGVIVGSQGPGSASVNKYIFQGYPQTTLIHIFLTIFSQQN